MLHYITISNQLEQKWSFKVGGFNWVFRRVFFSGGPSLEKHAKFFWARLSSIHANPGYSMSECIVPIFSWSILWTVC